MLSECPSCCHISSQMCGAKGERIMVSGSMIALLLHFNAPSSLTQIMKVDTDVLRENLSMSSCTVFIVLWSIFNSSLVAGSSPMSSWSSLWLSNQNVLTNLLTPSMPLVSQGFDCSIGPKNISSNLRVSAPY